MILNNTDKTDVDNRNLVQYSDEIYSLRQKLVEIEKDKNEVYQKLEHAQT